MRILAIRGKNLASLEGAFAVELEQPPLDRAGLFAITGPTGAGKSTLLDAICLALFDEMPRLPKSQGAAVGRADEPEERRIKSTDVCSILRRGSGEAYAEADFVGNDGHRYRARWEVSRARGKADGRLQAQKLRLTDLTANQPLGRNKTEILDQIAERLGLNFDQFRRAVLLPQGDFAAFLKVDAKSRSELLERITGTEIYGELSKAAHRRGADEKKLLEDLEKQLGASKPLAEATRQEMERQRVEQQHNHEQAEQTKQTAQHLIDWHRRLVELERLETGAVADLAKQQQALQAAEPRRQEWQALQQVQSLRSLVDDYDRVVQECEQSQQALEQAIAAEKQARGDRERAQQDRQIREVIFKQTSDKLESTRPLLEQARHLDQRLIEASSEYEKIKRDSEQAASQAKRAEQQWRKLAAEHQDWQAQHDKLTSWLAGNTHLSDLARQWERWDTEFGRYLQAATEVKGACQRLQRLTGELAELSKRVAEFDQQSTVAQQSAEDTQSKLQLLHGQMREFSLDVLRRQRDQLEKRRDELRILQGLAREAGAKNKELAQVQTSLHVTRERLASAGREAAEKARALEKRQIALSEAERALQLARTAHKEDVKSLRAWLQDGEPCPVCGATEHPWARDTAPLAPWLEGQQQRVAELKRQEHDLTVAHSRLETARDHAHQQAKELAVRSQTLNTELVALRQCWAERLQDEGLSNDILAEGLDAKITDRLGAVESKLSGVKEAEGKAVATQQQIDKARKELDKCQRQSEKLQTVRSDLQHSSHQLDAEKRTQQAALERAGQTLRELAAQFATPLAGLTDWREALAADPRTLRAQCERQALQWRKQQEESESLAKRLQEFMPLLKEKEIEALNAGEQAALKATAVQEQHQKLQNFQQLRKALFEGRSAAEVESTLKQAKTAAGEDLQQAVQQLEGATSTHTVASNNVVHWNSELGKHQAAHQDAQQRLNDALTRQGLDLPTLRRRLRYDAVWLETERAALEEVRTNHERVQERLKERRGDRERHQFSNPPSLSLAEAQTQLTAAQADSATAYKAWVEISAQLSQDDDRRQQIVQLQQEYETQRQRWERWESLRELIGSHDGSVFRTYAQSLTLDILLAHANRHLEDLTRRYRLERVPGSDLDLQVIDCDMGDEVRSVHSLSGGESFLVSLALALGLASLSSQRTQVESLFIDEGFGSLDSDTLDVAIASLDALQAQGRKVGVISHVPAMVERIGVQVRVEARGGGRSVVRVVGAVQSWGNDQTDLQQSIPRFALRRD